MDGKTDTNNSIKYCWTEKIETRSQENSISTKIAVDGKDEIFPAMVNFRI